MVGAEVAAAAAAGSPSDWRKYSELPLHPILAAALADFQQYGYHGSTVRGIAARVGVTMPSLYYHYGSKEGILFALLDVAMDDLQTRIDECLEDAGDDNRIRFENFVTTVALHNTHRRDLAMLHGEYRFLGPTLRGRYLARRAIVERTLEDLLDAGIADGSFYDEDTHWTARVLFGMLGGILDWYRESGPLTPTEIAERYKQSAARLTFKGSAG